MKIALEQGPYSTFLLRAETGDTRLVQFDSDFPGVARSFGWEGPPRETRESIWDAYEFLEQNVGADIDDPGYFD